MSAPVRHLAWPCDESGRAIPEYGQPSGWRGGRAFMVILPVRRTYQVVVPGPLTYEEANREAEKADRRLEKHGN